MKFGIMLNHQFDRGDDLGARLDDLVALTERARDLGYASAFVHHHYLANLATPQPVPLLGRLVPASGTMQLGVAVYLVPFEHPVQLAETFATLDQLSGGRIILGVGAGYRDDEFDSFGVDRSTRGSRLVETLELVRELWSGEEVHHKGEHFEVMGQTISMVPAQQPRPPIWIGANGEKTIRRAARIGDAWIGSPNVKFRWAKGNLGVFQDELRTQGIDPAGREYPLLRELYVGARDEVEPYLRQEYLAFAEYDDVYVKAYEEMWEKAFLIGSADEIAEKIADLADGGFNHLIFRTNWPGTPVELSLRTIERFATEVMPRFA